MVVINAALVALIVGGIALILAIICLIIQFTPTSYKPNASSPNQTPVFMQQVTGDGTDQFVKATNGWLEGATLGSFTVNNNIKKAQTQLTISIGGFKNDGAGEAFLDFTVTNGESSYEFRVSHFFNTQSQHHRVSQSLIFLDLVPGTYEVKIKTNSGGSWKADGNDYCYISTITTPRFIE